MSKTGDVVVPSAGAGAGVTGLVDGGEGAGRELERAERNGSGVGDMATRCATDKG